MSLSQILKEIFSPRSEHQARLAEIELEKQRLGHCLEILEEDKTVRDLRDASEEAAIFGDH